MYLYYKYKGDLYEIPIKSHNQTYDRKLFAVQFDRKLDPRVDKLGWCNVNVQQGIVHSNKLWLHERNFDKAKQLFNIEKCDRIEQLKKEIKKLEKGL